MDEMGSTPSHEANGFDTAAPAVDAAPAPLQLPPTPDESKPANRTTTPSVDDKRLAPDLKRKLETRDEEAHATKAAPEAKRKKTQKASIIIGSIKPGTVSSMAPADPIDFTDIKEWIAAYEANPQPSFLTPAQRKAILDLKASLVQDVAAPEIGEEDWVSALNMYRDTDSSKRRGVEFQYEDVGANGQFKCFCNFKGPLAPERITFPREDCGFVAVDTKGTLDAPSFSKKKDARRYAAKSTVAWLLRQGEVVKFPKVGKKERSAVAERVVPVVLDKTVPLAAPKDGLSRSANTEDEVVAHPLPQTSPPAESKSANGDTLPGDTIEAPDETPDIPATVRVRELSKALGFQAPAYRFSTADNGQQGFYNGCADYGTDAFSFPSGIGYVTDCYSRNGTKEQIAAEVLKHLLVVQAKRKEKLDALTAEFSGDASGGATLK